MSAIESQIHDLAQQMEELALSDNSMSFEERMEQVRFGCEDLFLKEDILDVNELNLGDDETW